MLSSQVVQLSSAGFLHVGHGTKYSRPAGGIETVMHSLKKKCVSGR